MNFNLKVEPSEKLSPSVTLSVVVTRDIRAEIQQIKRSNERNRRLFLDLTKQFFDQLVEKFKDGEFDETA